MVYIIVPVVAIAGGVASAYTMSQIFRSTEEAVSNAMYGSPADGGPHYPRDAHWNLFDRTEHPSASTTAGKVRVGTVLPHASRRSSR